MRAQSAPAARTGPDSSSSPSASTAPAIAGALLWRSRKSWPASLPAASRNHGQSRLGAYWLVVPVAIAILATHRPRADVAPRSRARVRGVDDPDQRRPRPRGLVRPIAERRRRHLLSNAPGEAGQARISSATATACSCSTRAATTEARETPTCSAGPGPRTSTLRSPGCKDGPTSTERPHRRHRLLRRWRDDAPGRRLQHRAPRRRLGGRGGALGSRATSSRHRGLVVAPEAAVQTAAVAVLSGTPAAPSLTDSSRDLPASDLPDLRRPRWRRRGAEPRLLPCRPRPEELWRIAEAGHVGGFQARPRAYEERVTSFFDRALLGPTRQD